MSLSSFRQAALAIAAGCTTAMAAAPAIAQEIPGDPAAFTELVAARLRAETGGAAVVVDAPLTLKLGELQANLDRIFAFCKRNASSCPTEIDRYVKGAAEVHRDRTTPPTREQVRMVVRPAGYGQTAPSAGLDKAEVLPRPFVEGLVALPVVDTPRTMKMLGPQGAAALGLAEPEIVELGLANLRRVLPPLMSVAKPVGKGDIAQIGGNVYEPSRLLLLDAWAPLAAAQGGVLVVAIPTTDLVLYAGEESASSVDALRALARDVMRRAPNRLSATLLRWKPSGWEVVAP